MESRDEKLRLHDEEEMECKQGIIDAKEKVWVKEKSNLP